MDTPVLKCGNLVLGELDPVLRAVRDTGPVTRVRMQAGDEAWLVTRLAELRQLLLDPRLSKTHPDPAARPRYVRTPMADLAVSDAEPAAARERHGDIRGALVPHFTGRKMQRLADRVAALVDEQIDVVLAAGPPAGLTTNSRCRCRSGSCATSSACPIRTVSSPCSSAPARSTPSTRRRRRWTSCRRTCARSRGASEAGRATTSRPRCAR
ncbi:hypothetical protein [Amycolatopsis sp. NPDC051372]|uniref:hypothetical protein n=1 Tax=Amycolatopsis sp. NPDC051372 TaxID=3155669 RepID=UPI0034451247